MTFYNIIFGILFLGAFGEVIRSIAAGPNWVLAAQTGTLSLLIFADTIYTAVVIEGKGKRYTTGMKLLDLLSFVLLSAALVVIDPNRTNLFQVDARAICKAIFRDTGCGAETVFWTLLSLYWIVLIGWNWWGGIYAGLRSHRWLATIQPIMLVLFSGMTAWSYWQDRWPQSPETDDPILIGGRALLLILSAAYLIFYKPVLTKQLDAIDTVALCRARAVDVDAIHQWPSYPPALALLDYALRRGVGWLDQFPESGTTRRFVAWLHGKRVGFSILTNINTDAAEFYIAVHPDDIHKGIGREITRETVAFGFRELGLGRIYLKVRTWHVGAQRLYESEGFKVTGACVELVHGQPVHFVKMERYRPIQPTVS